MKTNSEIVEAHYKNFTHICDTVTSGSEYSLDLCSELCLYLLEKVSNEQMNYLDSIEADNGRTQLDYYFFRAALNQWNNYTIGAGQNRSIKRLNDNPDYLFESIEDYRHSIEEDNFKEFPVTIKEIKKGLTEAEKCFVDLYISCNGYKTEMMRRSDISRISLIKYEKNLIKKCKRFTI